MIPASDEKTEARRHLVFSWQQICQSLSAQLLQNSSVDADPFVMDTVIFESAGHQRMFTQYFASHSPHQISCGIDFANFKTLSSQLGQRLLGIDPASYGWASQRLTLSIKQLLSECSDQPWFKPIAHHLANADERPGRMLSVSRHFSQLFLNYCELKPQLLDAWDDHEDINLAGSLVSEHHLWQPNLWRMLRSKIDDPDPRRFIRLICESLKNSSHIFPGRLLAGLVNKPSTSEQLLLDALLTNQDLFLCQLACPSSSKNPNTFLTRYATNRVQTDFPLTKPANAQTTLAEIHNDFLLNNQPTSPYSLDGSIQFHASHGLVRQVEVLREIIVGLLEDDKTLEPRDILVLVTNLNDYASHIRSAFSELDDYSYDPQNSDNHPGRHIRVKLAKDNLTSVNQVLVMVLTLLKFSTSRCTALELMDFLRQPTLSYRFHLSDKDLESIEQILRKANTSWGIDGAQRSTFGVADQRLGTWWHSVTQALFGAVMADEPASTLTDILALPHIDSSDLDLIGRFAEIITRIRKNLHSFTKPASAAIWAQRLNTAIDELADLPTADAWQISDAKRQLVELTQLSEGLTTKLSLTEISVWLNELINNSFFSHSNFGDGSLFFTQLGTLQAVEHRVICVLGLDDNYFPVAKRSIGDDLISALTAHSKERNTGFQHIFDAVCAAKDKFIVVYQGQDEHSGKKLPVPAAISDLLAATGRFELTKENNPIVFHPVKDYELANFTTYNQNEPFSFDQQAFANANAALKPKIPPPNINQWQVTYPAPDLNMQISGGQLKRFFRNPAAMLLKTACGLQLNSYDEVLKQNLPLDLNGLDRYQIRSHLVDALVHKTDPNQAKMIESLSGLLLQNQNSIKIIENEYRLANQIYKNVLRTQNEVAKQSVDVSFDVSITQLNSECEKFQLNHRIDCYHNRIISYSAGNLTIAKLIDSWVDLLFLSTLVDDAQATIITRSGLTYLKGVDAKLAKRQLSEIAGVYWRGLRQLVPLPAKTADAYIGITRSDSNDPLSRCDKVWISDNNPESKDLNWTHFYPNPEDLHQAKPSALDPHPDTGYYKTRFEQLAHWFYDPINESMRK